jgi:hypothetical protein
MFDTYIEIFSADNPAEVKEQANDFAKQHNAEIVSADFLIRGETFVSYYLTVVFKEKRKTY